MNVEDVLSEFKGKSRYGYDYEGVSLAPMLELYSYDLVDGDWNAAPSAETFVGFARRWDFVRFAGSVSNGFSPEEISGVIPQNFTREQVLEFVSDLFDAFGNADEKRIKADGYFRFWFD